MNAKVEKNYFFGFINQKSIFIINNTFLLLIIHLQKNQTINSNTK